MRLLIVGVAVCGLLGFIAPDQDGPDLNNGREAVPGAVTKAQAMDAVAGTPLVFATNRGQVASRYRFHTVSLGETAFFADDHVVLSRSAAKFVIAWEGARASRPQAGESSKSRHSFLFGSDESKWQQNVAGADSILYPQKYADIDLEFTGEGGSLKSTYIVHPGGNPLEIRWRYLGDVSMEAHVLDDGSLSVRHGTMGEVLREQPPIAWQVIDGEKVDVPVSYIVLPDRSVGFQVADYDEELPLLLDPVIVWATFIGGSGTDTIHALDVDAAGMVYLTGYAHSKWCDEPWPLHAQNGATPLQWWYGGEIGDAFVVKIDPRGNSDGAPCPQVPNGATPRIVYSTRLGGGRTYTCNTPLLCTDPVLPVGPACCPTWSTDPVVWDPNCFGFVAPLPITYGAQGPGVPSFQWYASVLPASYYPYPTPHPSLTCPSGSAAGTRAHGSDHGFSIAVDSATGEVVVVGRTEADDFPGTGTAASPNPALVPAQNPAWQPQLGSNYVGQCGPTEQHHFSDAFISRLNADGTELIFSTYFGGLEHEQAFGVDLDSAGNAYVVGYVESTPAAALLPPNWKGCAVPNNAGDGFLLKFGPTGIFEAGRYLGGTDYDIAIDVAIGPNPEQPGEERVYVTGTTRSADFTQVSFVDPNCSPLAACPSAVPQSFYAGHFNDEHDFVTDPRTPNLYGDAWVARISTDLDTCEVFTYLDACALGGFCWPGQPLASDEWAEAIAVDSSGTVYIAAVLGVGLPEIPSCAGPFAGSFGALVGLRLNCSQPSYIVGATVIAGDDSVHPFDIDVDDYFVYVAGSVSRFNNSTAPSLSCVQCIFGSNFVYDHRDCNGNVATRPFNFSQIQQDFTCFPFCATVDGFIGAFFKTPAMPPVALSYLGGEGLELFHGIRVVSGGVVVGGTAKCGLAPRRNALCETALYNGSEIDVPGSPGHCSSGGGYGPLATPNAFSGVYQGTRYAMPGSGMAYLAFIVP